MSNFITVHLIVAQRNTNKSDKMNIVKTGLAAFPQVDHSVMKHCKSSLSNVARGFELSKQILEE
jgi:hypothetical protein